MLRQGTRKKFKIEGVASGRTISEYKSPKLLLLLSATLVLTPVTQLNQQIEGFVIELRGTNQTPTETNEINCKEPCALKTRLEYIGWIWLSAPC